MSHLCLHAHRRAGCRTMTMTSIPLLLRRDGSMGRTVVGAFVRTVPAAGGAQPNVDLAQTLTHAQ